MNEQVQELCPQCGRKLNVYKTENSYSAACPAAKRCGYRVAISYRHFEVSVTPVSSKKAKP